MKLFIVTTALLMGLAIKMPVAEKEVIKMPGSGELPHHLLHILEGGNGGGHKFHVDRQQNFEITHDGNSWQDKFHCGLIITGFPHNL